MSLCDWYFLTFNLLWRVFLKKTGSLYFVVFELANFIAIFGQKRKKLQLQGILFKLKTINIACQTLIHSLDNSSLLKSVMQTNIVKHSAVIGISLVIQGTENHRRYASKTDTQNFKIRTIQMV